MIVSVTGHADLFDLIFSLEPDGHWAVSVPPDISDGRYVCDIYAANAAGEIAYWTGILYMTDGRFVCLHLIADSITAYLLPECYFGSSIEENIITEISGDHISIDMLGERFVEKLIWRCHR